MSEVTCPVSMSLEAETISTTTSETSVSVPIATETQMGVGYVATNAEVMAGETDRGVHPCGEAFLTPEQLKQSIDTINIDYSLEEQWTGKHWIDGKKIYQKTVVFGQVLVKGTLHSIPHNIPSMDTIVAAEHSQKMLSNAVVTLPNISTGDVRLYGFAFTDENILLKSHTVDTDHIEFRITIRYTCTDR